MCAKCFDFTSSLDGLSGLRQQVLRSKYGASHVPVVLFGNKSDLKFDRDALNEPAKKITEEAWSRASYYQTNAKAGWRVDDVVVDVCRQILWENLTRPLHVPRWKICTIL